MVEKEKHRHIKTVILGAGLAGLSAAGHSKPGGLIFEKEKTIGGTCKSINSGGFTFDLGIHVLHTRNRYVLNLLERDAKLSLKQKMRSAWIYSYGVLTKYPIQANTYGLPADIVTECLTGFMAALKIKRSRYSNYEEWVYGTFGKGIADYFYLPYSEKFWTVSARKLTTDWLDVRVPRPSLKEVISGALSIQKKEFGPNAVFRYPKYGGIQSIAGALINKDVKVRLNMRASRIQFDKRLISFKDRRTFAYDKIITSIPLPELINIIDRVPRPVKQAADSLMHNSVICVNLGIKRQNLHTAHWIYFPEKEYAAFRVSFPKNFSQFCAPNKWSSVQAEISYSKFKPLEFKNIVDKVIKDLIRAKILRANDKIKLIGVQDIKYAYVIYDHNRPRNLKTINKFLRDNHIYTTGRYGEWEYIWMDQAILSGKKAAREAGRDK